MYISLKKNIVFFRYFFIALSIISGIATFFLWRQYHTKYSNYFNQAEKNATQQVSDAAEYLSKQIQILKPIAQEIAQIVGSKKLTSQQLEELLKKKKIDSINGVGVAFLPHKFDPTKKLFIKNYIEKEGKLIFTSSEGIPDYTKPDVKWFNLPLKSGAQFIPPYSDEGTTLAEYGVPIVRTNADGTKETIGVAFANQSVQHLQQIIDTLFLGRNGYWFILTETGSFLAYPQLAYRNKTIFDIAKDLNNPQLANAAKKIIANEQVTFEYNNEITGEPSWLISHPIKETKWNLVGVFDQGETGLNFNRMRHRLISFSLAILLMITSIMIAGYLFYPCNPYLLSLGISIALLFQIILVWNANYVYPFWEKQDDIYRIPNKIELYQFMKDKFLTSKYHGKKVNKEDVLAMKPNDEYVPVGIYINELQLTESNEIIIGGYLWQRLTKELHKEVLPGFVFNQTNNAKIELDSKIEVNDDTTLYTYNFYAKIHQFLKYVRYPFDAKQLRIKFWGKSSNQTYFFVYDLDGYQLLNPRSLPGIDHDLFLPGWTMLSTSFAYASIPYMTNWGWYLTGPFGVYEEDDPSGEPQPVFEIEIRRDLLNTLISDLIPIAVISVFLFIILLSNIFDPTRFIGAIASVFFATIFAHIRFRGKIPQSQVVYLESLYFILYIIMLLLIVLLYCSANKIKLGFITHNNNHYTKLLFWPLFLGTFAICTLIYLW